MGEHKINIVTGEKGRMAFLNHLLDDLKCLERMYKKGMIEDDKVCIGAEQEFCLVNDQWRPAKNGPELLKKINDPHFTTELARFNLEINLDPVELCNDAFPQVERQLRTLLKKAMDVANKEHSKIVLTGILPSISKHELELDFMTPDPRYYALNDLLREARGDDFTMQFSGVDELSIKHNSVMFETCNTSFQMHLQIDSKDFTSSFNWAQAISGPVLGVSVNAPLLFGKELWSETRIALFQQSIDTRTVSMAQTEQQARVTFGTNWITGNVIDFYKKEVSQFKILLSKEIQKSSLKELKEGKIPKLGALSLHNSTIYRWNRPCYGVRNGKPHIRLENRYIPSGPTITDEIANLAFWVGLMKGRPKEFDQLPDKMDFQDAKSNFFRAARTGSEATMNWMGKVIPLKELVLNELLPISRNGLELMNIDQIIIDRYLDVIRERLLNHTGSQWIVKNYRTLKKTLKPNDALIALTEAIHENQQTYDSVKEWPSLKDQASFKPASTKIGHIMTSSLVTANPSDLGRLTLKFMKWNNIHHLPVVNNNENLVGLITWRHLKQYWDKVHGSGNLISAKEIMVTNVFTVETSTPIKKAIAIMKKHEIGCLPVIQDNRLVGIVTIKDLIKFDDA